MLALPFGLLLVVWGAVGLVWGRDPRVARPLRLAGDVGLWAGMALFALLGFFAAAEPETGPVLTLVAFASGALIVNAVAARPRRERDAM